MKAKTFLMGAFIAFTFSFSNLAHASVSGADSSGVTDNDQSMLAVNSHHGGGHGGGGGSKAFGIGGQLAYNMYFGGSGIKVFGLGINGEYYSGKKWAYRFLFNYHFAYTAPTAVTLISQYNYQPPWWMGSTMDSNVNATDAIHIMTFGLDVKKVFGHDYGDGGLYGAFGIGLTLASETITANPYNTANWQEAVDGSTGSQSFSQLNIRLALGYDAKLNFGTIFAEALLILPVNSVNGNSVDVSIPTALSFQAGVRIPLLK